METSIASPIKDGTRTFRKIMVQAAEVLQSRGKHEFTEWELTVQMWKLYPKIVGLPGYEAKYPDHKRVYCELIKSERQAGEYNKFLRRTRPNHYKLCPAKQTKPLSQQKEEQSVAFLNTVSQSPAFYEWRKNPEEPKRAVQLWPQLQFTSAEEVESAKKEIEEAVAAPGTTVPYQLATEVHDFLSAIQYRFFSA